MGGKKEESRTAGESRGWGQVDPVTHTWNDSEVVGAHVLGFKNLREPTACCILHPLQISVFVKVLPVHLMLSSSFELFKLLSIFG